MAILEDLWKGEICPGEQGIRPRKEYTKVCSLLERQEAELREELSERGLELLEEFKTAQMELTTLTDCDSFIEGFRMGAQIMLEVMGTAAKR